MADRKISELSNITGVNLNDADEFVVVDTSADETKALTFGELKAGLDTGSGFVRITGDTMTGPLTLSTSGNTIFTLKSSNASGVTQINLGPDSDPDKGRLRYEIANDLIALYTGNNERLRATNASVTINEIGADLDFRVESDGNSNAIFMNAGNGTTAFGTTTDNYNHASNEGIYLNPGSSSSMSANSPVLRLNRNGTGGNNRSNLEFYNNGNLRGYIGSFGAEDGIYVQADGNFGMHIYTDETVINEESKDHNFRVEGNTDANLIFADAGRDEVKVGTNLNVENAKFSVHGAKSKSAGIPQGGLGVTDSSAMAQGVGGGITLNGQYTSAGVYTSLAAIEAEKVNGTSANYDGKLVLKARKHGGANISRLELSQSAAVFNEDSENTDFRVESDGNNNMIFVNAGSDRVSIGMAGGSETLNVKGSLQLDHEGSDGFAKIVGPDNRTLKVVLRANDNNDAFLVEDNRSAGSERLTVNAGGEMVVNDTSADYDFRVESDSNANMLFVDAGNNSVHIGNNDGLAYNQGIRLYPDASMFTRTGSGSYVMYLNRQNYDGDAVRYGRANSVVGSVSVTSSGTTYNTTSDRRLKTDIQPITDGTQKLMGMNPVMHKWKSHPDRDAVHGFIAQEMQGVVPEAVSGGDDDAVMMAMDYGRITPVLVAALQDAHKKIEELTAEIKAIKEAI